MEALAPIRSTGQRSHCRIASRPTGITGGSCVCARAPEGNAARQAPTTAMRSGYILGDDLEEVAIQVEEEHASVAAEKIGDLHIGRVFRVVAERQAPGAEPVHHGVEGWLVDAEC